MGKRSREKNGCLRAPPEKSEEDEIENVDKAGERPVFYRTRAWMKKTKMTLKNLPKEAQDREVAKARAEFLPYWMREAGVEKWEDMDFEKFPQIHLEFILCDPAVLRDLQKPGGRERLFEELTEEEQYIYLNERGSGGRTYAEDLEGKRGMTRRNIAKTIVKYRKTKKMMKTM